MKMPVKVFISSVLSALLVLLFSSYSMASGEPYLVKDINAGSSGSFPNNQAEFNGALYFTADDGVHGNELWKSDGTAEGTVLVKDINPGVADSNPYFLTKFNGMLYFTAADGNTGYELRKSDGTEAGTVLVKDIRPGSDPSFPNYLTEVGGTLYFNAYDSDAGPELWKSDGTPEGTVIVKDICPGTRGSYPVGLVNVNGTLFFEADDGTNGWRLWKSDGTEEGTVLVRAGEEIFNPLGKAVLGGALYFGVNQQDGDSQLWKTDGTPEGTVMVKDIASSFSFVDLFTVKDKLYFIINNTELWKSDGTDVGTVMVKDISNVIGMFPYISSFADVEGTLYFTTTDDITNFERLWKSDGTEAGTVVLKEIFLEEPHGPRYYEFPININGTLYFEAYDDKLWKSDGTPDGTVAVKDLSGGYGYSKPTLPVRVGSKLFFSATDYYGEELWALDLDADDTTPPSSTITTPTNGATLSGASYKVSGTASDNSARSYAYVVNSHGNDVSVIDLSNNEVVDTVSVGEYPQYVYVSPDGRKAYVTSYASGEVSVIDTSTNSVVASVGVGYPYGIAVSPDGSKVYVPYSFAFNGGISVIDASTNSIVASVEAGTQPLRAAVTPNGRKVYVTDFARVSDSVLVMDTETNTVSSTIGVGWNPVGVAVNPAGTKAYVANSYLDYDYGTISVIDTFTDAVVDTIEVGHNPFGVTFNPSGTKAYVANYNGNNVSVIDTSTDSVVATVAVGDGPGDIWINPDGNKAYVTNYRGNNVSVIDTSSNTVIDTIGAGTNPVAISAATLSGVQYVDISTNGGSTWQRATGTSSWSYDWNIGSPGQHRILSRATDNAGNVETPGSGITVTVTAYGSPELPVINWDYSFASKGCASCHETPSKFLPANYRTGEGFCYSCHNAAGVSHEKALVQRGHSTMVNVTSGGCRMPTYGNVTAARYNNQPFSRLKDGDKLVCITCHNVMEKTEDYGRVWEPTTTTDRLTYALQRGRWSQYGYLEPVVYRDTSLWGGPAYSKAKKDYMVSTSEYTYNETAGTISFHSPQSPSAYIYVTLDYPYLRASNADNTLCLDCHTQTTHKGINCMNCHQAHNTGNLKGIRDRVRTANFTSVPMRFMRYTGAESFAGGATHDGICEVCHTATRYYRRDGSGFANHSSGLNYDGKDCTSCHMHSTGFAR